tara:strand:- start:473 stop:634 length:162 start_codon:yes stop_codon:yes gene_type:complete
MRKNIKNSIKFNKVLELILNLKVKLYDTKFEKDIIDIDQRIKTLFETFKTGRL